MAGTILIVDDDPALAATLEIALLAMPDVEAKTLHDGRQAIQFLERAACPPSAVLTDLDMPRVDGYELIRWIRSQPALLHTPVLAMSAAGDAARALDAGANLFIEKPYSIAAVREIVKEWMHA